MAFKKQKVTEALMFSEHDAVYPEDVENEFPKLCF